MCGLESLGKAFTGEVGGAEVENATGFKKPLGFSKGQKVAPPKEPRGEQNAGCEAGWTRHYHRAALWRVRSD